MRCRSATGTCPRSERTAIWLHSCSSHSAPVMWCCTYTTKRKVDGVVCVASAGRCDSGANCAALAPDRVKKTMKNATTPFRNSYSRAMRINLKCHPATRNSTSQERSISEINRSNTVHSAFLFQKIEACSKRSLPKELHLPNEENR